MFSYGLKHLLRRETDFKIIGEAKDIDQAIGEIQELQPDVVIIYTDEAPDHSTSAVIDILQLNSNTKVIALNLQNNIFHVYQAKMWVAKGLQDLVEAIQEESTPAH
jgi:DNA-binding NarL/FixJ family response regulator